MSKKELNTISAHKREASENLKQIRKSGFVPGVAYGNKMDNVSVKINYQDLEKWMKRGRFFNTPVDMDVSGEKIMVLPYDIQTDPVRDRLLHVDLLRVKKDSKIKVRVPIKILGKEKSAALKFGGLLNLNVVSMLLECKTSDIPEEIAIDIAEMRVGDSLKVREMSLPANTRCLYKEDYAVLSIIGKKSSQADEEESEEDEESTPAAE